MIDISIKIWKDIVGYEGVYQVSNHGDVKSLDRIINYTNGNSAFTKGKMLSAWTKKNGYKSVDLYKQKKSTKYHVHRLVAEAFILNPNSYPQVNHKDENKANNNMENLEWCTCRYNLNYGTHNKRVGMANKNNPAKSSQVIQYDMDWNLVKEYPSASEAARQLGILSTSIIRCCRKRCGVTQCGGYRWTYKDKIHKNAGGVK